jgi:vacuolar-type H+-ATPase subunit I/STV1
MDLVRHDLEGALRLARFDANVQELLIWVDEKLAVVRQQTEGSEFRAMQFEEKLTHLRQHQAMEIQLSAHSERIDAIRTQLTALQKPPSHLPESIEKRAMILLTKWDELGQRSRLLSASLQEARELFDFTQSVDRVLVWIRDKQLMLQVNLLSMN